MAAVDASASIRTKGTTETRTDMGDVARCTDEALKHIRHVCASVRTDQAVAARDSWERKGRVGIARCILTFEHRPVAATARALNILSQFRNPQNSPFPQLIQCVGRRRFSSVPRRTSPIDEFDDYGPYCSVRSPGWWPVHRDEHRS